MYCNNCSVRFKLNSVTPLYTNNNLPTIQAANCEDGYRLEGNFQFMKMGMQAKSVMHMLTSCASNLRPHRPTSYSSLSFSRHSHTITKTNASEWQGLPGWRKSRVNENRRWGVKGPEEAAELPLSTAHHKKSYENDNENTCSSLAEWGALVLSTADPVHKACLSHYAYKQWCNGKIPIGAIEPPEKPSRPDKPELVSPREIPSHKNSPLPHNAHILHNLAHIELNAIDLAWDTVVRFSTASEVLGSQFFSDFAHVADDESRHFSWCLQRLGELGFRYGDMPAHNLLWRECQRTSGSVIARMAAIPMVQEARGLDAGPRLVQKLVGLGDNRTSNIVKRIAEEEIAHVAVGVSWFLTVCGKMGRMPDKTFTELLEELNVELKGPYNYAARTEAGIPRDWYDTSNLGPARCDNKLDMKNEKERTIIQVASTEQAHCNSHNIPISHEGSKTTNPDLSEVYERLACIVAMEKESSEL